MLTAGLAKKKGLNGWGTSTRFDTLIPERIDAIPGAKLYRGLGGYLRTVANPHIHTTRYDLSPFNTNEILLPFARVTHPHDSSSSSSAPENNGRLRNLRIDRSVSVAKLCRSSANPGVQPSPVSTNPLR